MRGSDASSVAAAVIKSTGIYPEIVKQLMSILEKECRYLSGQRSRPSPFHLDTPNNLKNFTFKSTATYLESHCPLLFKFLVTSTKWDPAKNDDRHLCCMIMAGCIILNSRNPSRNTLQSLIAIVLHGGHASKLVSDKMILSVHGTVYNVCYMYSILHVYLYSVYCIVHVHIVTDRT